MTRLTVGVFLVLFASAGCATGPLTGLVRPASPHEAYVDTLRKSGLDQTALGRDWLSAAQGALTSPFEADLPFSETGYFAAHAPSATAYRFELQRGRRLSVEVSFDAIELGRIFVDLFRIGENGQPRRVSSMADAESVLSHDVSEPGTFVLRVQPELLRSGRFTVTERTQSTLVFPVSGFTARGVQSGFGTVRDAGIRQHEGIDIFAPRGTPVVAVTSGVARTDTNGLGGNVVWLQPAGGRRTFYYAHLERWAIEGSAIVGPGDTLGFVGNSGNARTTAPHLHFGIYERGAVDPLPFVQPDDATPAPPAPGWPLGTQGRVRVARTFLREGFAATARRKQELERGTLMTVLGASGRWLRVQLPDETAGYLVATELVAADRPLGRRRLSAGTRLHERPSDSAPAVRELGDTIDGDVLGTFGDFAFVSLPDLVRGWVRTAAASDDQVAEKASNLK